MEFNLSDKIFDSFESDAGDDVITVYDVKEFIKLLKRDMFLTWDNTRAINKLAGDALIDNKEVKAK